MDDNIYALRTIRFRGQLHNIILQSANGPCPLLAIANILILRGRITVDASNGFLTSQQLRELISTAIRRQAVPSAAWTSQTSSLFKQNVQRSIEMLPELERGLDINVGFLRPDNFEFTEKIVIFDTLSLQILHGWVADPSEPAHAIFQSEGVHYNTAVERSLDVHTASAAEQLKWRTVLSWMDDHPTQLTPAGLAQIRASLSPGNFAVFFRNNHFSALYRTPENIFMLCTDFAYNGTDAVWEIPGISNSHMYDADFHPLPESSSPSIPDIAPIRIAPTTPTSSQQQQQQHHHQPSGSPISIPASTSSTLHPTSSMLGGSASSVSSGSLKSLFVENTFTKPPQTKTLRAPRWPATLEALRRCILALFSDVPESFNITYRDPDGDYISITSGPEFEDALSLGEDSLNLRVGPLLSSIYIPSTGGFPSLPSTALFPSPNTTPQKPTSSPLPSYTKPIAFPSTAPAPVLIEPALPPVAIADPPAPAPSPASPTAADLARFVPSWFRKHVLSLYNQGYTNIACVVEALIRSAGNVEVASEELSANSVFVRATPRVEQPDIHFAPDFATAMKSLVDMLAINPYLIATALILNANSINATVFELTEGNAAKYERLLTPAEVTGAEPHTAPATGPSPSKAVEDRRRIEAEQRRQEEEKRARLLEEQRRQLEEQRREDARRAEENRTAVQREQELYDTLSSISLDLTRLDASISDFNGRRPSLTTEVDQLRSECEKARLRRARIQQELREAEEALARMEGRLGETETELSSFIEQEKQLQEQSSRLAARRSEIETQLSSFKREINIGSASINVSSSLASFSLPGKIIGQLAELEKRGFLNPEENFEVLMVCAGDLEKALEELARRRRR